MFRRALRVHARRAVYVLPALLSLGVPSIARANTVTVTDCTDSIGVPGGGPGQLRRLMNDANAGDTIMIPACTIAINGNAGDDANVQGDLDVTKDLTIVGTGAATTALVGGFNLMDRLLHVLPGVTATISNLTISDSVWFTDGATILNQGTLHLTSVTLRNNGSLSGNGGGIYNDTAGTLTVADSTLSSNSAQGSGGALYNKGNAILVRTAILQNSGSGGGVFNTGVLALTESTLSGNQAANGFGGAIQNTDSGGPGQVLITGTTISGNGARYGGGGIFNSANAGSPGVTLTNSTISGNSATDTFSTGGGILNMNSGGGAATISLTRVTITGNTAPGGGNNLANAGGGTSGNFEGTIVTGGCLGGGVNASSGHNLDTGNICFIAAAGDQQNVADVKLGPLADNGGPTLTHMPASDSPAVNAGGTTCSTATDQRGIARPQGPECDIGAVEWTQDVIFQDGFESGDTSKWSSTTDGGGDLSVTAGAALAGTNFGLQASVNDTAPLYVEDLSPAAETFYRARFYLDPNGFDPGEAQNHFRTRIFLMFDDAGTRRLSALVLKRQGGNYFLMQRCRRDDNTQADTGFFSLPSGPHWILVEWQQATGAATGDGRCALTIDGTTVATLPAVQNNAGAIGKVRLGTMSVKAGATGTPHFDEFVSRRRGAIPPVE